jgi:hypothetical protein
MNRNAGGKSKGVVDIMSQDISFEVIWNNYHNVLKKNHQPKRCPLAQQFFDLINPMCQEAIQSGSTIRINQVKLQTQDSYFNYRAIAPQNHRFNMNPRSNHICLFHVYEQIIEQLRLAELKLCPPQLYIPEPPPPPPPLPPPPPPPQIGGIFLEEINEIDE